MSPTHITTADPSPHTLIAAAFEQPDYRDAFIVQADGELGTVDAVATAYFLGQPRWLSAVSMNLRSRGRIVDAIGDRTYAPGSSIGSWTVRARNDDEIVFGDDMGFMQYCFSFWRRDDGSVEASTAVAYTWPRASRWYFALVKPMHRRFVPISLRSLTKVDTHGESHAAATTPATGRTQA